MTLGGASTAPAVIKLPSSALTRSDQGDRQGSAVWVFDAAASTVQPREVQVAGADGNEMVIVAGLKPGEEGVATGVHVLSPGQKVTVYQPKTAVAPVNQAPAATDSVANGAPQPAAK